MQEKFPVKKILANSRVRSFERFTVFEVQLEIRNRLSEFQMCSFEFKKCSLEFQKEF
jgi:hypothetical protein